jgi:glycosyl hydrolase family 18 (putative chitinase)
MRTLLRRLSAFAAVTLVLAVGPGGNAGAATAPVPLPAHVYAPYFETWTTDSIATTAQQSGAKYFTLAFLESTSKTSCTLAWNGDKTQTVASGHYVSDIANLRAAGGDVILSLGGWSADQGGTEIADSCSNVQSIANAYEQAITEYNVSRLDMDVEGRSLTNTAGIDRRNKAIAIVEQWDPSLQISYTIPTTASGLESTGVSILKNAVANNATINTVDLMAFDYYDKVTTQMGTAAENAVTGAVAQMQAIYPGKTQAQLYAMMGITLMPGIDDYPKKTEVTTIADAQNVEAWAKSNNLNTLSIWAIQRDNGGCPGNGGANNCSGIVQNTWDFSKALEPFTGP